MVLGQSAWTAACLALDDNLAVQDVTYEKLRAQLLADLQVLELEDTFAVSSAKLDGIVVDDRRAKFQGQWQQSSANKPFVDSGYSHNGNAEQGLKSATFEVEVSPGMYEVRMSYPANNNRASNVPVKIQHESGQQTVTVNQRIKPPLEGKFVSLGKFRFGQTARVVVETADTNGHVIADAIQFLPIE